MAKLQIGIRNISGHELPTYATDGASGVDVRALLDDPVSLKPLERLLIPTGLFLEIPQGHEAQVRPRSGSALKQGLTCLNSPGTIDSDYRGELKVIIVNLSNEEQTIQPGDRIAQLVFQKVESIEWVVKDELTDTARGEGGFGHTGKN